MIICWMITTPCQFLKNLIFRFLEDFMQRERRSLANASVRKRTRHIKLNASFSSENEPEFTKIRFSGYFCSKYKKMTASTKQPLSNIQLELLQMFAADISEEEMLELRRLLIDFRAKRLQSAIQQLNPSPSKIEEWSKGHDRTPYKSASEQK